MINCIEKQSSQSEKKNVKITLNFCRYSTTLEDQVLKEEYLRRLVTLKTYNPLLRLNLSHNPIFCNEGCKLLIQGQWP